MSLSDQHLAEFDRLTKEANELAQEADRRGEMPSSVLKSITEKIGDASECLKAAKAEAGSATKPRDGAVTKQLDPEWREFMTPGSVTKEYWARPAAEMTICKASDFTRKFYAYDDTSGADSGAGFFWTPELYRNVVMGLVESSGVLEANPTLVITNHLRDVQVPILVTDATATAGVEGSDATAAETVGDGITLAHYRYDGVFSVSAETAMSASYNLDALLAEFASRAIANQVAAQLALGDGTTEPAGLFTAGITTAGKTAASATSVTADEMIDLVKSVSKGYRKRSKLVVSDVLHTSLLKLKDDTDSYVLRSVDGGGYQFCGLPVFTEPQADQTSMSASEIHAVCGDFSGFFVRMTPMLFHRDDHNPLVLSFRFAIWIDSAVADAGALRHLVMAA